jgi:hypothetical protein
MRRPCGRATALLLLLLLLLLHRGAPGRGCVCCVQGFVWCFVLQPKAAHASKRQSGMCARKAKTHSSRPINCDMFSSQIKCASIYDICISIECLPPYHAKNATAAAASDYWPAPDQC